MFPTRRLSLPLVMVVFSSTALASAYEIDRPDSAVQPSAPYYPLLFSAFISNLAGHLGLGNDRMTLRSLDLVFDLASLESPTGAFQTDTAMRLTGTSCRAPASFNRRSAQENGESVAEDVNNRNSDAWERVLAVTYDLRLSPASGEIPTAMRPETALAVDEFPCLDIPSPRSLSAMFRPRIYSPVDMTGGSRGGHLSIETGNSR
jgi:hypothetical protein